MEYLPVIIEALEGAHTALAAYPLSNRTPVLANSSIFGVINVPSAAPPLYKEISLKPKSSAKIIITLGFFCNSKFLFKLVSFDQYMLLFSSTGFAIFIIVGSEAIKISYL